MGFVLASPAEASGYRWTEGLNPEMKQQLQTLFRSLESKKSGILTAPVDVTGRLRKGSFLAHETLMDRLRSGGPVMYPLALICLAAAVLICERFWILYFSNRGAGGSVEKAMALCGSGEYGEAEVLLGKNKGVVSRTLLACLAKRENGSSAMEDAIEARLLHEMPRLRRFFAGLTVLAAVAPLLGLLGTVTGIIETFGVIRVFGNANPGLMAGGISEALVTTAAGLIIAIPILLVRSVFKARMDRIIADTEDHAASLLNMLSGGN